MTQTHTQTRTVPQKVVDRLHKLVRLAVDGSAMGDREVAAMEAARLIHEHGLTFVASDASHAPVRIRATREQMSEYKGVVAKKPGTCAYCGGAYMRGEALWWEPGTSNFLHVDWPCDED